ncbi:MAG: hypothetical protein NXI31_25300 [bacterium]|nr:hypothetical protein [bacterium]
MSALEPIPEARAAKVEAAVAEGDIGRAVELLEMWIDSHAYTQWALERLGRLWLAAGFRTNAGRALFWAGVRDGEGVQGAIDQFLREHKRDPKRVLRSLRRKALLPLAGYPGAVRRDLEKLGISADMMQERLEGKTKTAPGESWFGCLLTLVFVIVLAVGVGAVVRAGVLTILGWFR